MLPDSQGKITEQGLMNTENIFPSTSQCYLVIVYGNAIHFRQVTDELMNGLLDT